MRSLVIVFMLMGPGTLCFAQGDTPDIQKLVVQVNQGADDAVREQLPSLLSKHPNHPGVLYLQALLTREGADAVRTYQGIVDNFPQSEWADDALYKVYQFYYALGLYRTAELKLNQLRTSYPNSVHARAPVTDVQESDSPATTSGDQPTPATMPQPGSTTAKGTQKAGDKKTESAQGRTGDTVKENVPVPVRVQATDPSPEHPEAAVAVRFSLQVGAFTLQANAEAQKEHFESLGYTADMVSKVRDTRSLFIVLIGDYATYDEAKIASVGVKKKLGIDAFVISR